MPDNSKLIAQANGQTNTLNGVAKEYDTLSKQLKVQVTAAVPTIEKINAAADACLKAVVEWAKDITDAKKTQALIDKVKEAAVPAKNLKDATGKAEKFSATLKNEADMAKKIADKSGKEDAAIGAKLKSAMPMAEKALDGVQSYAGPGGDFVVEAKKALTALLAGKSTLGVTRDIVRVVAEDLQGAGEAITTAESVYSSFPPIVKLGLDAYIPEVKKEAQAGQVICTKLAEYIPKARTKLGKDRTELKIVQDRLNTFK